jgi:hypothetical protein
VADKVAMDAQGNLCFLVSTLSMTFPTTPGVIAPRLSRAIGIPLWSK